METIKLSRIVMKFNPELVSTLTSMELDSSIVLRNGFQALEPEDALEIIQFSICEHQKDALLH